MKRLFCLVLAVLMLGLTACNASGKLSATVPNADSMSDEDAGYTGSVEGSLSSVNVVGNRKLVKDVQLTVETKKFDSFLDALDSTVSKLDGYIESAEQNSPSGSQRANRYASVTVRVPAEKLSDLLDGISGNGTITYKKENVKDITASYIDTESRIAALSGEQETLLSLLKSASSLSDILEIQARLSEVTAELESYKAQLNSYDNLVEYSTVNLNVNEVERETQANDESFWSEIGTKISNNLYNIGKGLRAIAVWLISSLPYFVIIALVALAIILPIRYSIKRKKRIAGKKDDSNK